MQQQKLEKKALKMNDNFWFKVDVNEVATRLNQSKDLIENTLKKEVELLSTTTHAFIKDFARKNLSGYLYSTFEALNNPKISKESSDHPLIDKKIKGVRWIKEADGVWVVEIDEEVMWIEKGRPRTFMGEDWWLLKPGKSKTAKDGSTYRAIPFVAMKGNKPTFSTGALGEGPGSDVAKSIIKAAKQKGIDLSKVQYNNIGEPVAGPVDPATGLRGRATILDSSSKTVKLNVPEPKSKYARALFFSPPRSPEQAKAVNLSPHSGIFKLKNAIVTQHESSPGKFSRETITFRVISSKHREDGRWFYPEVKPLNSIQNAYRNLEREFEDLIKGLEEEINRGNG